jgi:hypothetical protein
MNRFNSTIATAAFLVVLGALVAAAQDNPRQQAAPSSAQTAATAPSDVQKINDDWVAKFSKQIEGHEQEPAEKVFKNIQVPILKRVPAGRFLIIMNLGYSRALGVACTYCHVESDFASDDLRPKKAAREMAAMHLGINQQLAKMQNLAPNPQGHFINCSTCHRGAIDPMAGSN